MAEGIGSLRVVDNKPVDRCSILMKATNIVDARQFFGEERIDPDWVTNGTLSRKFPGPFNLIIHLQDQSQDYSTSNPLVDVWATPRYVDET